MGMGRRIKEMRIKAGLTQEELGEKLGLQKSAIAKYENGRVENIKRSVIKNMADILNCSPSYLLCLDEDIKNKQFEEYDKKYNGDGQITREVDRIRRGCRIPVLGKVAAGIPIDAIENIIDYEEIPEEMARHGQYFGLKIKGDSMSPRIAEGDTVIVRKQEDADSGDVVIVLINGHEATCKRLMKYRDKISLISFNPLYKPMEFTNKEIMEKPVQIIGRVMENRQKY